MIRTGADFSAPFTESPDVCIIGSGAGGATAADALARAGLSVLVLEGGGFFQKEQFTQRERETIPAFHAGRGARQTVDGTIAVMGAEMIGGTTVINMADCAPIPAPVLAKWARDHGVTGLTIEELTPVVEHVHRVLGANRIPEDTLNANNRLLMDGSRELGMHGETFLHSRVDCVGCGYCTLACAYDAKQSALVTWVPRATEAGARFYANCRVTRIRAEGRRIVAVEGNVIDPESGRPKVPFTVRPGTLILSAGTINSPALLLASGLANSSGQVGKNLILQPQMAMTALFDDEVVAFRGIPQSFAVQHFHTADEKLGNWGFDIEGVFGTPGTMAAMLPAFGDAHRHVMQDYRKMAACLVLVPDAPSGQVTLAAGGRPEISYTFKDEWRARLAHGAREAVKCYLAAGAREVVVPSEPAIRCRAPEDAAAITPHALKPGAVPLISAHPQGTCRMGADPQRSVVDSTLKAHDLDNLYVMDASVFPSTASSHIQVPIMSVTWLNAQRLAKRLRPKAEAAT